jgi:hypothetical protein
LIIILPFSSLYPLSHSYIVNTSLLLSHFISALILSYLVSSHAIVALYQRPIHRCGSWKPGLVSNRPHFQSRIWKRRLLELGFLIAFVWVDTVVIGSANVCTYESFISVDRLRDCKDKFSGRA